MPQAPPSGSNQENAALLQIQQTSASLPRHVDAVEGSPYGFRAAGKVASSVSLLPFGCGLQEIAD